MIHLLFAVLAPLLSSASLSDPMLLLTAEIRSDGELIAFALEVPGERPECASSLLPLLPGSLAAALAPAGSGPSVNAPEQSLVTTVQDVTNPEEPWIITTYRKPGESQQAFVKRHRDMVNAVRDALGAA